MRVVCDNCGASYKIPDSKLTKEVNKATCRKCGHAIFIRRDGEAPSKPPPAAPPPLQDERTLITSAADLERAVRDRSSGVFDNGDDGRPTTVSLDNAPGEATVPRDPLPPLAMAPPVVAPRSSSSAPMAVAPPEPVRAEPPRVDRSRPAAPAAEPPPPMPRLAAPVAAPPVAPPPLASVPAAMAPAPLSAAPAGAIPLMAAPAGTHDPRSDLLLALFGSLTTFFGLVVLVLAGFLSNLYVIGAGLFLGLLGLFVTVLVLLTGGRGTRPASWVASVGGSFMLSLSGSVVAGVMLYALWPNPTPDGLPIAASGTLTTPTAAPPSIPAAPPLVPPAEDALAALADATPPTEPVAPPVEAAPPVEPVAAAPAVTPPPPVATPPVATPPVAAPPVATPPAATTPPPATATTASKPPAPATTSTASTSTASTSRASQPTTTSRTSSTTTSRPTASRTPPPEEDDPPPRVTPKPVAPPPEDDPPPVAEKPKATGISPTVIDTMIKSNKGVKSCFINQKAESGDVPHGVKVKLTIQPTGKVSSAAIPSGDWKGTPFESCLSGAVRGITFPPFDGNAVTVTYPFSI